MGKKREREREIEREHPSEKKSFQPSWGSLGEDESWTLASQNSHNTEETEVSFSFVVRGKCAEERDFEKR